jgi:hypothetical protein
MGDRAPFFNTYMLKNGNLFNKYVLKTRRSSKIVWLARSSLSSKPPLLSYVSTVKNGIILLFQAYNVEIFDKIIYILRKPKSFLIRLT